MSEVRAEFWKEVRKKCWELSKEQFQWTYPIAAAVFVLVVVWIVQGWDALMENAIPALAAGSFALLVAFVVYGANFVRATNIVVDAMRKAPYDEGVAFRAEVALDTVLLHIRHRVETGFFSAQLWMMNGGVPLSNVSRSLSWSDTASPRRVLVRGEDHTLKLMRFEVVQPESENHLIAVKGFVCGPGGIEHETPVNGLQIGRDWLLAHPILLHINVTDSAEESHRVLVQIDLRASKAKYASISSHLVRDF